MQGALLRAGVTEREAGVVALACVWVAANEAQLTMQSRIVPELR